MNKSEDIALLAAALVKAQPMIEGAAKDTVNPFFKSKYADLASVWDACSEALQANNLAVSQLVDEINGHPALTTMLIHESGQWISGQYPLIVVKPDPQSFGSAISYARRYGLSALLGVLADDDDGEAATRDPKPSKPASPGTPQTQALAEQKKPASEVEKKDAAIAWGKKALVMLKGMGAGDKDKFNAWYDKKSQDGKDFQNRTAIARMNTFDANLHTDLLGEIDRLLDLFNPISAG